MFLETGKQSSLVEQKVKDPAWSLYWLGIDPWPRNVHVSWMLPKKQKQKTEEELLLWLSGYESNQSP